MSRGFRRTYSGQFSMSYADASAISPNTNVSWTTNPTSPIIYIFCIVVFHLAVSVNVDTYLHGSGFEQFSMSRYAEKSFIDMFFNLGKTQSSSLGANSESRIWWGDAWNVTAVAHGVASWVLMHWIKGSANFYDQNDLSRFTWFEQLAASPSYGSSYYSPRFLLLVPLTLTYISCHVSSYDLRTTALQVVILGVLVVSKMDIMHGVRVFGINNTAGVDDGTREADGKDK